MPQRTNKFQALIHRIQKALHSTNATVAESAEIPNHTSPGSTTEVDILVTFTMGGSTYRTAIECQGRGRQAGPAWIRELNTKRLSCRLDKIIAVHSKGFSKTALNEANSYGIEALAVKEALSKDVTNWVFDKVTSLAVQVSIPKNGIGYDFDPILDMSRDDLAGATLVFPDNGVIPVIEVEEELRQRVTQEEMNRLTPRSPVTTLPNERDDTHALYFKVLIPPATQLITSSGKRTNVRHMVGRANVRVQLSYPNMSNYILRSDTKVQDGAGKLLGAPFTLTLTKDEKKCEVIGAYLEMRNASISASPPSKRFRIPPIAGLTPEEIALLESAMKQ